jgi:nucleotide-binding universal stress UspA family protein
VFWISSYSHHASSRRLPEELERDTAELEIGATILNTAADYDVDLIVMGAYGHTRLREWIMGDATAEILKTMTIPILFSH